MDDAPVRQHEPVTHSGVGSPGNHEFTQFVRFDLCDQPAVGIDDTNGRMERLDARRRAAATFAPVIERCSQVEGQCVAEELAERVDCWLIGYRGM